MTFFKFNDLGQFICRLEDITSVVCSTTQMRIERGDKFEFLDYSHAQASSATQMKDDYQRLQIALTKCRNDGHTICD